MKVVVGAEESTAVSEAIVRRVRHLGHDVVPMRDGLGWAEVGLGVASAVSRGAAVYGIALCGNGVGVTIAANKVSDVRAALCPDTQTALGSRRYLDANVATLGYEIVDPDMAADIVEVFLTTNADLAESEQIALLPYLMLRCPQ
ncbi:MAG: ribose 5-phosphate isomerase [Mycobacterium sp.]|jgi:ribose 5-phosphate isomerase B|nr:ribose 5-phosphate isomerase [Mycobacterium sp.]